MKITQAGRKAPLERNPVLPVHAADPHLALFGNRYYLYCSDAGVYESYQHYHAGQPGPEGAGFAAWSSPDLVHWRSEGRILSFSEVGWAYSPDHSDAGRHAAKTYAPSCGEP